MSSPATRRAAFDSPVANALSVLEHVDTFMQAHGLTQQQVARKAGFSTTYLSQLLSDWREGRIGGSGSERIPSSTRDELIGKLDRWLEDAVQIQRRAQPDDALPTQAVKQFLGACKRVKHLLTIGVVVGAAGMGKTLACRVAARQIAGTMVIEAGEFCSRPRELLRAICVSDPNVFRRTGGENTWARLRADEVHYRLAGAVLKDTDRLLIVDEAHKVSPPGFEFLRQINESWRLPIVLVGTIKINARLSDDADPHFGQMSSRIGLRLNLVHELVRENGRGKPIEWVTPEQLDVIAARHKLRLRRDVLRDLSVVANREAGHLRRVGYILQGCEFLAAAECDADKDGLYEIGRDIYERAVASVKGLASDRGEACEPAEESARKAATA